MAYLTDGTEEAALNFSKTQDWRRLDGAAVQKFAQRAGLDPPRVVASVDAFLTRVVTAWKEHHAAWPMAPGLARHITEHWGSVPLLKAHAAAL